LARPTAAQIRRYLDDLGLDAVDPQAWLAGVLPEILRGSIDLGRLKPTLVTSGLIVVNHIGAAVMVDNFAIQAPGPNQIIRMRNLHVFFTNALTETFIIQKESAAGALIGNIWVDFGGPFAFGPYIGTDNTATQAWANKEIIVYGANPGFLGVQQTIAVELQSAAAIGKNVTIAFDSDLYEWEDWPGN